MKFELIATTKNGGRENLSQSEFVGDGLVSMGDAVEAAKDAIEYADGEISEVDVYCDENQGRSNGWCGYVDADRVWHMDEDCEL